MSIRYKTISFAATALLVGAWSLLPSTKPRSVMADPLLIDQDSDGDFLPDIVEWACLSNANDPDTDDDGISDFVEVVQRGSPRAAGQPRPTDHEMRVVVTSVTDPLGIEQTNLHLLFRFMGQVTQLTSFQPWLRTEWVPGLNIPLDMLASNGLTIDQRVVPNEGLWVRVRVPLASSAIVQTLLPGTIGANATIGGRSLEATVPLIARAGQIFSLVPFDDTRLAFQNIGVQSPQGGNSNSNRVCVFDLELVGAGQGGPVYRIVTASCEDCNDLLCAPGCAGNAGELVVLPGGIESITGG